MRIKAIHYNNHRSSHLVPFGYIFVYVRRTNPLRILNMHHHVKDQSHSSDSFCDFLDFGAKHFLC